MLVGTEGRVVSHSNTPYRRFTGDEPAARYTPERLVNVEPVVSADNELADDPPAIDGVEVVEKTRDPQTSGPTRFATWFIKIAPRKPL